MANTIHPSQYAIHAYTDFLIIIKTCLNIGESMLLEMLYKESIKKLYLRGKI